MECNVIKDLLPLYIDKCCSEESVKIVEEHLNECAECKAAFENMNMLLLDDSAAGAAPQNAIALMKGKLQYCNRLCFLSLSPLSQSALHWKLHRSLTSSTAFGRFRLFFRQPAFCFLLQIGIL